MEKAETVLPQGQWEGKQILIWLNMYYIFSMGSFKKIYGSFGPTE